MKIYPPKKVYIARSKVHGWGVFASELINDGEIIEETPLLDLQMKKGEASPTLVDYRFNWPQGSGGDWQKQVIAWGYGCIYNHSNEPNATWVSNLENETFQFIATKEIKENEEIFTYYGGVDYWNDGRANTNVV
jgi:SET domain-containing protein